MLYRVVASLERVDEGLCASLIEELENAFKKMKVKGKIFVSAEGTDFFCDSDPELTSGCERGPRS
jgi:hypothetical protein